MAELKIISETGMFHIACRTKIGPSVHWYGFKPKKHLSAVGQGFVDTSDRSALVNHSITFNVSEPILRGAIKTVTAQYANKEYILGVRDCVSFGADVARYCQLLVPHLNLSPYGFIEILGFWNTPVSIA
jgi:hypothetical protein